jgi:NADH:ubiquinone oxidoreductase subunit 3 (subunit A)
LLGVSLPTVRVYASGEAQLHRRVREGRMPFIGPRWHWPYIAITTGIMILTVFYAVFNAVEDVAVVLFIVFIEALFAVMLYAVGRSIEEWKR